MERISDKLKELLNESDGDAGTSLSWSTRIKGFKACFILGMIMHLFASLALVRGDAGRASFVYFFTLGNIVYMLSVCFLMGPVNLIKKMFTPTLMVFVMIGLTFFCAALFFERALLPHAVFFLQLLPITWYTCWSYYHLKPYIPGATKKIFESYIALSELRENLQEITDNLII